MNFCFVSKKLVLYNVGMFAYLADLLFLVSKPDDLISSVPAHHVLVFSLLNIVKVSDTLTGLQTCLSYFSGPEDMSQLLLLDFRHVSATLTGLQTCLSYFFWT